MMQITIVDTKEKNEGSLTQKPGDQMESLKQQCIELQNKNSHKDF